MIFQGGACSESLFSKCSSSILGTSPIDLVRTAFTSLARGEMQLGPFEPGDHLALRVSCHSPAMQGFPSSRAAPVEIECRCSPHPRVTFSQKFVIRSFLSKSFQRNFSDKISRKDRSPMMMMSENFRKIFSLAERAENTCRPTTNQLTGKMWRTLLCL